MHGWDSQGRESNQHHFSLPLLALLYSLPLSVSPLLFSERMEDRHPKHFDMLYSMHVVFERVIKRLKGFLIGRAAAEKKRKKTKKSKRWSKWNLSSITCYSIIPSLQLSLLKLTSCLSLFLNFVF